MYQLLSGGFGNIETALVIEGTVKKRPIVTGSTREEGGMPSHSIGSILNQGVGGGKVGDTLGKSNIECAYQNIGDSGQHSNSSVVERGIDLVAAQQCIGWTHL